MRICGRVLTGVVIVGLTTPACSDRTVAGPDDSPDEATGAMPWVIGTIPPPSNNEPMSCQTWWEGDEPHIACSCPLDMHFDGNGGCACDNGGETPDCDPPPGGDPGGGDPGDPGDPGGGGFDPDDQLAEVELDCNSPVVRAGTLTCVLVKNPATATIGNPVWKYLALDASPPDKVGGESWSGPVVLEGTVEVSFHVNGVPKTLSKLISVTPRSWSWAAPAWQHGRDVGSAPSSWDEEPEYDGTTSGQIRRGQLCSAVGCGCATTANPLLYPDFRIGQGYSVAAVPPGGPNAGIWYVSAASLGIYTKSWTNDGFKSFWPKRSLPSGAQADACRTAMGLPPGSGVEVNFWTFNGVCEGIDVGAFHTAMLDHEEDHHGLVTTAAAQPAYDARTAIEALTGASETVLRTDVKTRLGDLSADLYAAANATQPTGNWNASVWLWRAASAQYQATGTWSFAPPRVRVMPRSTPPGGEDREEEER